MEAIPAIEQTSASTANESLMTFKSFPKFAKFIREHHLIAYVKDQIRLCRELDLPLLKHLSAYNDEQILELGLPNHTKFLVAVEENKLVELLEESNSRWRNNQIELVDKDDIAADDMTVGYYIRKQSLIKFLPLYTTDALEMLEIIKEIDAFVMEAERSGVNTYINILKEKLDASNIAIVHREEQLLEAQEIGEIGSFEWDLIDGNTQVTPQLLNIFEMDGITNLADFLQYVYPSDRVKVQRAIDTALKETGVYECEYRYEKNGKEKVIWSRGKVMYKDGVPASIKGTIMNVTERHHMIQQLQRSEDLYKQAQQLSHMGNYAYDMIHDRLYWSDELYRIFGLEPQSEVMTMESVNRFIHPDYKNARANNIISSTTNAGPFNFSYRIITDDGVEKYIQNIGETLKDEKGKPYKMVGSVQDITEKQTLINQLERSDKLYKQAEAIANMGNSEWDIATRQLKWSDEIYRIYGTEPQTEYASDYFSKMTHPDDYEYLQKSIAKSIETLEPYDVYYRIVLQDGTIKTLHAKGKVVTDDNGKATKTIGTIQDVTEQKRIEKRIKDYQEFIQKITDVTPSIITSYNIHTGIYSFVNQAIEKILGYDIQTVLDGGIPFITSLVHPDDIEGLMEKNAKALQEANKNPPADGNEKTVEFKYRLRHANGKYHWMQTLGTIFERDDKNEVESILNISIDITKQEEAEQVLHQKNLQLQQSNSSLEEYAYVASHDLKEPLRKISTYSDRLLNTQKNLTEDGKLYLNKVIDSSTRMQTLINDLLSVSIISGDRVFETTSLKDILDDVLLSLEHKIEEKNAKVISDDLPTIKVVKSQMRQLFQNLINNSLKFTRQGVTPTIEISHTYLTPSQVADYDIIKAKKYLQITFLDNGIGFENIFSNKIFTIFQRLHGKNDFEGNGIGLTICRKVVEAHGGVILAHGIPNKEAKFTIILPS